MRLRYQVEFGPLRPTLPFKGTLPLLMLWTAHRVVRNARVDA